MLSPFGTINMVSIILMCVINPHVVAQGCKRHIPQEREAAYLQKSVSHCDKSIREVHLSVSPPLRTHLSGCCFKEVTSVVMQATYTGIYVSRPESELELKWLRLSQGG